MSQIDLVVTDLDSTLFYDREHVTDRDRAALEKCKERGIRCAIATGRELEAVTPALDRLELWDFFTHIIHSGGGGIYDIASDKNEFSGMLSTETLCEVFDRYVSLGLSFVLPMDSKLYTSHRTPRLEIESRVLASELIETPDLKTIIYKPMSKIVMNGAPEEVERALPILLADADPRYQWHRSHDNYVDCYARGINKGSALQTLCAELHIAPAHVLAIGDNENDIQLLDTAGKSACPGNGTDSAKAHSDYICCAAHEGAFADMCEHFLPNF